MRKLTIISCMLLGASGLYAQRDMKAFEHLSLSVDAGTTGLGVELAVPLCPYLALRAGVSTLPLSADAEFDFQLDEKASLALTEKGINHTDIYTADLEGELNMNQAKLLLDVYPFRKSGFHFTFGAYFGPEKMIKLTGTAPQEAMAVLNQLAEQYPEYSKYSDMSNGMYVGLDDYKLVTDKNGRVHSGITVNSVKPYVGIGFGRAVPRKRIGIQFEMGAMFQGRPSVYCSDQSSLDKLSEGADADNYMETLSEMQIYPVVSLRLVGRIF